MQARLALVAGVLIAGVSGVAGCGQGGSEVDVDVTGAATAGTPGPNNGNPEVLGEIATDLEVPWGVDFLPDGRAIVTERDSARVLLVTPEVDGATVGGEVTEIGVLSEAEPAGEGGLLGVAVSPTYDRDRTVFFYLTTATDNRVVRAEVQGEGSELTLGPTEPVLTGIPAGTNHNGGRIGFGPDGLLYVATGESGDSELARDRAGLGGKILRITPDGEPGPGNPFGDAVWSWGHRNIEGLTWDAAGNLWASEFGQDIADELNLIVPGSDYGWPEVEGSGGAPTYTDPVLTWSPEEASPAGLAHTTAADGTDYLWMAALRGERLWRITLDGRTASDPTSFLDGYGRLRAVAVDPDGRLWVTTSNRDGRGDPADGDDRILLIDP